MSLDSNAEIPDITEAANKLIAALCKHPENLPVELFAAVGEMKQALEMRCLPAFQWQHDKPRQIGEDVLSGTARWVSADGYMLSAHISTFKQAHEINNLIAVAYRIGQQHGASRLASELKPMIEGALL